jgi:uncharacterized membrane protein YdjX (TVP38/TMEM64 family)
MLRARSRTDRRMQAEAGGPHGPSPRESLLRSFFTLRAAVLLALLVGSAFAVQWAVAAIGGPRGVARFGWIAPLASALLHAPIAASPLPSEPFALSHGPLYGFWLGALVGWAGWFVGSAIEYGVLRRLRPAATPGASLPWPRWLARFPVAHPVFLIGMRQVPGGFDIVNVSAALAGVPLARFLWCSAIAQVPTALFISAAGLGLVAL